MNRVTELAPAKVNLYLKVIGKRADGYHDIETLFERIAIFDTVTVRPSKEGMAITCDDPSIPTDEESLCYRAAKLMKDKAERRAGGVKIAIRKKIPMAAGLGGGSSDAASILKALNKFWRLGLSGKKLMKIGSSLGADVPFFLSDSSFAAGAGRGDRVKTLESRKKFWHLIIYPNIKLLSGEIYKLYGETRSLTLTSKEGVDKIHFPTFSVSDIGRVTKLLHNDLEGIVLSKEPLIRDIKNALAESGSRNTLVSGSGPSVYGLYETRGAALKAKALFSRKFPDSKDWRIFVARTY